MSREYVVNSLIVLGLAVLVSLSWVGVPTVAGWSRFVGSVLFYSGIEITLWFVTQPLVHYRRELAWVKNRRRLPPD